MEMARTGPLGRHSDLKTTRIQRDADRVSRNINIPTLVLALLDPRNQAQFSFNKDGEETVDGPRLWRVEFQGRTLPTLVHRADNRDQPVAGRGWVDPVTGEVWLTSLAWAKGPGGNIGVMYVHATDIGPLVPLKMSEGYTDGSSEIRGEVISSNFRQSRTSWRLVTPRSGELIASSSYAHNATFSLASTRSSTRLSCAP